MKELSLRFYGIDGWNRPVFKDMDSRNFYGDVDHLFGHDVEQMEVINFYSDKQLNKCLSYFGYKFNCEPEGREIKDDVSVSLYLGHHVWFHSSLSYFKIVKIDQIPDTYSIWPIGNHAPDGYLLFAHFNDCHMIDTDPIYVVKANGSLEIMNGCYAGWKINDVEKWLEKNKRYKHIYNKVVKALPYIKELNKQ